MVEVDRGIKNKDMQGEVMIVNATCQIIMGRIDR